MKVEKKLCVSKDDRAFGFLQPGVKDLYKGEHGYFAILPWEEWLQAQMYMQHLTTCAIKNRKPCDCGLDEMLEEE